MTIALWKKVLASVLSAHRRPVAQRKPLQFTVELLEDRTVPSGNPPTVIVNTPPPLKEGNTLTLDASGTTDPDHDPLTYSWDIDGDGVFGDALGVKPTLTAAQLNAINPALTDGPATFNVRVRVSDGTNVVTSSPVVLSVVNVAPTGDLGPTDVVMENSPAVVGFTGVFDPSLVDAQAGFTYSFDIDNDGAFDIVDSTSPTVTLPAELFPDGPGQYAIRGRITDRDGDFTEYTVIFPVLNVEPTATLTVEGGDNEGDPVTVTLSDFFDPSAGDTEAGFHFAFVVDGVGLDDAGYDNSGADPFATFAFDGDGQQHSITARIIDRDGGFTDYTVFLTFNNIAPTGTFSSGGAVSEGNAGLVQFTGQFDPSQADTNAGFTYSYDFDNDGNFEIADSPDSFAVIPANYFPHAPGELTVRGRITDKDGDFTEYTTTIQVTPGSPVKIAGPASGVRGQTRTFTFSAPNASTTKVTYRIDWGDGSGVQTVKGSASGVSVDHVFTSEGDHTISVKLEANGSATEFVHTTRLVELQTDPGNGSKTVLAVGGTRGDDDIVFIPTDRTGFQVVVNGRWLGRFEPTGGLLAFGQAGDDDIFVFGSTKLSAWLYGGDGDDWLRGSDGNDVLLGGDGDDLLFGDGGRDLLIAGKGEDDIWGNGGEDLIVTGTTAFDTNDAALRAILAEWTSDRSFSVRVANLGGTGKGKTFDSRLNGNNFLNLRGNDATVFNDSRRDVVHDSRGRDWVLSGAAHVVHGRRGKKRLAFWW